MTNREIQTFLRDRGLYNGPIDGLIGRDSHKAIHSLLHQERLPFSKWSQSRRRMAVTQILLKDRGIDVGEIDGLKGPQTDYALSVWRGEDVSVDRSEDDRIVSPVWPRQRDVEKFYGSVGKNQTFLDLPYPMRIAWDLKKVVHRITIHQKVHDSAQRVLSRVADAYPEHKRRELGLDLFGGSLNVRRMRGGSAWSMHSWGIAIDFDPSRNQLKWGRDRARLAQPDCERFWSLWEEEGWLSLGRARNFDWMHVQAAGL